MTVVSIEVLKAQQRRRERGFQDFWSRLEGKSSFGVGAEAVSAKFTVIEKETQA